MERERLRREGGQGEGWRGLAQEEEKVLSRTFLKFNDEDIDMMEMRKDFDANRFHASTQDIVERLIGRAMTLKDFFSSPEDQQGCIQYIVSKRKRFLAGNAHLIVNL